MWIGQGLCLLGRDDDAAGERLPVLLGDSLELSAEWRLEETWPHVLDHAHRAQGNPGVNQGRLLRGADLDLTEVDIADGVGSQFQPAAAEQRIVARLQR